MRPGPSAGFLRQRRWFRPRISGNGRCLHFRYARRCSSYSRRYFESDRLPRRRVSGLYRGDGFLNMLWLGRNASSFAALKTYFHSKVTNAVAWKTESEYGKATVAYCTYQNGEALDYELAINFFSNKISTMTEDGEEITIPAGTIFVNFGPVCGE